MGITYCSQYIFSVRQDITTITEGKHQSANVFVGSGNGHCRQMETRKNVKKKIKNFALHSVQNPQKKTVFLDTLLAVFSSVIVHRKKLMCPCITWDNIVSFNGSGRHFANLRALTHTPWVFYC